MNLSGLAAATTAAGLAAGWCAARVPAFGPLLWLALLVLCLALPPAQRRLLDARWLLVGVLLVTCSWLVALDHELALKHSLLFVAAAFLFALARLASPSDRLVYALAGGLALTAVVALHQGSGGLAGARAAVDALPPAWREAALVRISGGRAFGTAALPGHYAALLMLAIPLVAERVWRARGWSRAWWALCLALSTWAIVLTRSLAALAVAGALLLPLVLRGRRRRVALVGALAVAAVAVAALAWRTDVATMEPLRLRWVNWRTAAWVFARHPWLGVGSGGIGQAALAGPTGASNITPYAHNTPLQLLAEFGAAGALPLAAGCVWLVRLVRRGFSESPALALAVASLPLHNAVDFSAYAPEVLLPWTVLAGALAARVSPPPRRPLGSWVVLALLGGGTVLSALAWRSASALADGDPVGTAPSARSALAAARWAPWTVTPVEAAAGRALAGTPSQQTLDEIESALAERAWVQPDSAAWAEARSRVLLAGNRAGEALVWAREARRRAPWRADLADLEAACALPR